MWGNWRSSVRSAALGAKYLELRRDYTRGKDFFEMSNYSFRYIEPTIVRRTDFSLTITAPHPCFSSLLRTPKGSFLDFFDVTKTDDVDFFRFPKSNHFFFFPKTKSWKYCQTANATMVVTGTHFIPHIKHDVLASRCCQQQQT